MTILDDIMNGVQTYRNPKLVHLFDKLNLIENFGTGIQRTIQAYENTGKEPVFESSERYFFVTLPNLNFSETDQITDRINDLGLLILREIKRELKNYVDLRGSGKTVGYYLKH